MNKYLIVALALLISIAFMSTGFAQPKPAPEKATQEKVASEGASAPEKAPVAKKVPATKRRAAKPKAEEPGFVGKVVMANSGMIAVKGKKASVTFDARNPRLKGYKTIADVTVGDTVVVKYIKDGVMIAKLKGTTKTKAARGRGEERAKKTPTEELAAVEKRAERAKWEPMEGLAAVEKRAERAKWEPMEGLVRRVNCKGTGPCTVSLAKLTEARPVSRVTCTGSEPCTVSFDK